MNDNKSNRIGFTKTGFTKSGFGCCSHYKYCRMGKLKCFYELTDPEVQNYCAAFMRNQEGIIEVNEAPIKKDINEKTEQELPSNEHGQLSMF